MSEFQRFVTYINLYEKNSKIRSVGFAKIERQAGQCKMEIHMRGTGYTGISCPVYLFTREKERMQGISMGNLPLINGNGDGRFALDGNNIQGSGYSLEQICGFLIFATEHVMFASQWDDKEIRREQFVPMEDSVKKEESVEEEAVKEAAVEEEAVREAAVKEEAVKEEEVKEEISLKAAEAAPQLRLVQPKEEPWAVKWQFILENYPVLTPFEGEEEILCVRMDLKDLRLLPKRYWYLGNNSFLLHGFFNYRYFILGAMQQKDRKRWFLGVPGVFQSQEKVMAAVFGFQEYKSEKAAEQKTGQFGYWYRFLD